MTLRESVVFLHAIEHDLKKLAGPGPYKSGDIRMLDALISVLPELDAAVAELPPEPSHEQMMIDVMEQVEANTRRITGR